MVAETPSIPNGPQDKKALNRRPDKTALLWVFLLAGAYTLANVFLLAERFGDYRWNGLPVGLYSQWVWNLGRGQVTSSILGSPIWEACAPFILLVLAPVYRFVSEPFVLAVTQTVFLAAGCCGIYAVASHYLGRAGSLLMAGLFFLYPPLIALNSGDFHPAVLSVPFIAWAVAATLKGRGFLQILCLLLAASCDFRLIPMAAGIAFVPFLRGPGARRRTLVGACAAASAACFFLFKSPTGHAALLLSGGVLAPVFFWALSGLFFRAVRRAERLSPAMVPVPYVLILSLFILWTMSTPGISLQDREKTHLPVRKSVLDWLLQKVPPKASVLSAPLFLPKLANRSDLRAFGAAAAGLGQTVLEHRDRTDYAVMDFSTFLVAPWDPETAGRPVRPEVLSELRHFFENSWSPIENVGSVVLFRAGDPAGGEALFGPADLKQDSPYLRLNAVAADELELVGFTMESEPENVDIVRFLFYWKKLKESTRSYGMFFNIMTPGGRVVHTVKKPLCYQLYPFEEWPVGEVIREKYSFVVPEDLVQTMYEVHFGVYDISTNRLISLKSPVDEAVDRWGLARLIALDAI